jgi:hypothetical protein
MSIIPIWAQYIRMYFLKFPSPIFLIDSAILNIRTERVRGGNGNLRATKNRFRSNFLGLIPDPPWHQGCQIFLDLLYQNRENIPKYLLITKGPRNKTNGLKTFQMIIKYTKFFHYKALKNLPILWFLVRNIPSGNHAWHQETGIVCERHWMEK